MRNAGHSCPFRLLLAGKWALECRPKLPAHGIAFSFNTQDPSPHGCEVCETAVRRVFGLCARCETVMLTRIGTGYAASLIEAEVKPGGNRTQRVDPDSAGGE